MLGRMTDWMKKMIRMRTTGERSSPLIAGSIRLIGRSTGSVNW